MRLSNQCLWLLPALLPTIHALSNATLAAKSSHPYAVSILAHPDPGEPYFTCAGSLISSTAVLTSASCVEGRKTVSIRYGSHDRAKGGELADVKKIIPHPDYDGETMAWDFAVLKLKEEVELEKGVVGVIGLPKEDSYAAGELYRVAGWGKKKAEAKAGGSTKLREGGMKAVTRKDCSTAWGKEIGDSQMCVEHSGTLKKVAKKAVTSTSICDGDSGGPLVDEAGEVLQGVVSYGVAACDTDKYPNVFSFVFAAREWILENSE